MVIQGIMFFQVVLPYSWTLGSSRSGWQMREDIVEDCEWQVSMHLVWRWYTPASTFYWLEVSHMATPNYKGGWEMCSTYVFWKNRK